MTDDARNFVAEPAPPDPAVSAPPHDPTPAPRDRLWIHFAWEGVLAAVLFGGIAVWWLFSGGITLFTDATALTGQLYSSAPFLLLATALGLSLRARSVNLAVGGIAGLAGFVFARVAPDNALLAFVLALAAAVGVGVVLTLLVVVLKAPSWAASIGVFVAMTPLLATMAQDDAPQLIPASMLTYGMTVNTVLLDDWLAMLIVLAVLGLSVLGGAFAMLPPIRRLLGLAREKGGQPGRRGLPASAVSAAALLISSVLGGLAGILLLIPSQSGGHGFYLHYVLHEPLGIALALAIVLLGGTSLWGKRGGVFGTVLAALIMFMAFNAVDDFPLGGEAAMWLTTIALVVGFVVTWLLDKTGTAAPRPPLAAFPVAPGPVPPPAGVAAENADSADTQQVRAAPLPQREPTPAGEAEGAQAQSTQHVYVPPPPVAAPQLESESDSVVPAGYPAATPETEETPAPAAPEPGDAEYPPPSNGPSSESNPYLYRPPSQ